MNENEIVIINTEYEISVEQIGSKGDNGDTGLSAYQVWLNLGNIGTEQDFINSLKGSKGDDGDNGNDGLSAYEVWLNLGNIGTEQDFINSLKGSKGDDGDNGLSAYEVWLNLGNIGTEQDFINSLIGENGNDGVGVVAGGTTGQVLTKKSNTNYDTEWTTPSSGGSTYTAGSGITINNNVIYSNIKLTNNRVVYAGTEAAAGVTTATGVVAVGYRAYYNRNNNNVTAVGEQALANTGIFSKENVAVGYQALRFTQGSYNVSIGNNTNGIGNYNTIIGNNSYTFDGSNYSTILGYQANTSGAFNNCSAIGYQATTTGDNQIQLGNSETTTYCFGTVQNRSDARDKYDIKDINNALSFIMLLKPKTFKYNYRDAYFDYVDEIKEIEVYNEETQENEIQKIKTIKKVQIENDLSRAGHRDHSGLIAQDVKEALDILEIDLGLYQDHSINDGKDVKSLGYDGFIAFLIKAIQEQQEQINELKNEVNILKNKE